MHLQLNHYSTHQGPDITVQKTKCEVQSRAAHGNQLYDKAHFINTGNVAE